MRLSLRAAIGKVADAAGLSPYRLLDHLYVPRDGKRIRWARNLRRMPFVERRTGGQNTYAERVHAVGVFQTLMSIHLPGPKSNNILDVGCGTGLLGTASEPFLAPDGQYTGIDVNGEEIDYCRSRYPSPPFEFIHVNAHHKIYAPSQKPARPAWPLPDNSLDLVSSFGVWSNIDEDDAFHYFGEVARVLKPQRRAIITFFLLDEAYYRTLANRSSAPGTHHTTPQDRWIFDQPAYGSDAWFHPRWVHTPEMAIGITRTGLERLMGHADLALVEQHTGSWKETPGILFQDVLVFEKPAPAAQ